MENEKVLIDKVITINLDEFYMLMALKGLEQVYGFQRNITQLSEERMLFILNNMIKKGILVNDNEQLSCVNVYKKIVSYIEYSRSVIDIFSSDISKPKCICYMGSKMLVTSISAVNANRLQMKIIEYNFLEQLLKDFGYYDDLWQYDKNSKIEDLLLISKLILPCESAKKSIAIRHQQDGLHVILEMGNQKKDTEYINGIAQETLEWLWRDEE